MSERNDQQRDEIKTTYSCIDVAEMLGLHPVRNRIACFIHGGTHRNLELDDTAPGGYHCYTCKAKGDCIDLVMNYHQCSYVDALKWFSDRGGIAPKPRTQTRKPDREKPERDYRNYYRTCIGHLPETNYLTRRGISLDVARRHWIGYDDLFTCHDENGAVEVWKAIIIPTSRSSFQARNTDPHTDAGDRYRKRGKAAIFGYKTARNATRPIFICEGELDAMSIETAGGNAVALGSYGNWRLLLDALDSDPNPPRQPFVIALDNETDPDMADRISEAETALSAALSKRGYRSIIQHPYGDAHDANDALRAAPDTLARMIHEAEEAAIQTQYCGNTSADGGNPHDTRSDETAH